MVYSLTDNSDYQNVLDMMIKIRLTEEEIAKRYNEQKMRCPTHLSIGQEGVPAMLSVLTDNADLAVSSHRCHAHYIAKGGRLPQMIAEIYGKSTGCSSGKGGSMHLIDEDAGFMGSTAIVGNSIPVGVGLGLALKLDKSQAISIVYFGDGATEQGVYYESLNFAALHNLPVLFVCENNAFSVYSPKSVRQPNKRSIVEVASAMGVKSLHINGNNVEASLSLLSDFVDYVRSGEGPALVEADTYRKLEHCGPNWDDDLNYRPSQEVEFWKKNDPIETFVNDFEVPGSTINQIKEKYKLEIQRAFEYAEASDFPDQSEAYNGEYAI